MILWDRTFNSKPQKQTSITGLQKAIRHINIGTTPDIAKVAGLSIQSITRRVTILRKYGILAGDRTGYRPGPEFEAYYNFYSKSYFKSTGPLVDKEKKKLEKKVEELKQQLQERDESIKQKDRMLKNAPAEAVRKREAELVKRFKELTCKKCGKVITHNQLAEVFGVSHGTIDNRVKLSESMESTNHITDALKI